MLNYATNVTRTMILVSCADNYHAPRTWKSIPQSRSNRSTDKKDCSHQFHCLEALQSCGDSMDFASRVESERAVATLLDSALVQRQWFPPYKE